MKAGRVVKDTHGRGTKALVLRLRKLAEASLMVGPKPGVMAKARRADGSAYVTRTPITTTALANEYGVPEKNIPERSFMRAAFKEGKQETKARVSEVANDVSIHKIDEDQALSKLGRFFCGLIRRKMKKGPFEPNAPATLARKQGSDPLFDTKTLYENIDFEVK